MNIYYRRILVSLLVLMVMATIAAFPPGAYAESATGGGSEAGAGAPGERVTVIQEYTYQEGETPEIPDTITQYGRVFTLATVSEPMKSTSLPTTRAYTYQVPLIYKPEELSQVPPNVALTPVYGEGKRQVDRMEAIYDLPDNDVEKLPKQKAYPDTKGNGPGAGAGVLVLAEVRYEVTSRDKDGLPDGYTAHVIYRGEEPYKALSHYTAVATYTGVVTEDGVTTYTVAATYEYVVPVEDEANAPVPPDNNGDSLDGSSEVFGGGAGAGNTGDTDNRAGGGNAGGFDGAEGSESGGGSENGGGAEGRNAGVSGGGGSASSRPTVSLSSISPLGTAALVTVAAAVLTLLILFVYNRRRLREV